MATSTSGIDFAVNGKDLDITIYQGKTMSWLIVWGGDTPIDLTGYTARMQWRETLESSNFIAEFTTENGRITVDPLAGEILISLTASETAALRAGKGYWDLELIDGSGNVSQPQSGRYTIKREITR